MIKFTVLMSVYYRENPRYLDESLNSLAMQTCQADEIILVIDGGISNELQAVINKWIQLLPIITIPLKKNVGLGKALNIGLKHARNNLIARMDTDDVCVPERFEKQIKYFEENAGTIILGGAIEEYSENLDKKIGRRFSCISNDEIVDYSVKRNPFNHMTVMFNKSFILDVGGYHHHLYMEDYNLWLRCIACSAICHNLSDTLVLVRAGDKMIERRRGWSYVKSEFQLASLKFKCIPEKKTQTLIISALRIFSRILPLQMLSAIYNALRRSDS
ncbi:MULTISPECIES: glycosyltransferase [Citrobacter]|uniref:glycosyltransferase n=1 Tax=Citrobacter TaxID=544 RepID=UPI0006BA1E7A|nr:MULTISPECIES: glycosyltransferase [Citrobacter]ELB4226771.1 glycosyltransferase [Citrobacter amalonaticus]UYF54054.1 glycosyltransferase [Citrobacter amalonaticus]HED1790021.1 glycosyltransferase [Citrobacter amalonaticus]